MSKQRRRSRTGSENHLRPRPENEANERQEPTSERPPRNGRMMPTYDTARCELRVGNRIVKHFTQKSEAQETILLAFEEENWAYRIDDPLPGQHGQDAKERLRTTVKNLNRRQREPLLHFRVARLGTAVVWEFRSKRH